MVYWLGFRNNFLQIFCTVLSSLESEDVSLLLIAPSSPQPWNNSLCGVCGLSSLRSLPRTSVSLELFCIKFMFKCANASSSALIISVSACFKI
jgi:hypothetical protein